MAQSTSFIVAIVKSRAWHKVQCWPSLLWEYNSIGTLPLGIVLYWLLASDRRDKNRTLYRAGVTTLYCSPTFCCSVVFREEREISTNNSILVGFLFIYLPKYLHIYIHKVMLCILWKVRRTDAHVCIFYILLLCLIRELNLRGETLRSVAARKLNWLQTTTITAVTVLLFLYSVSYSIYWMLHVIKYTNLAGHIVRITN